MIKNLIIICVVAFGIQLNAASTSSTSTVAAINTVTITSTFSYNFDGSLIEDEPLFNYYISNNDIDGYNVTIASTNSSEMRLSSGYSASKNGTFFDYMIKHKIDETTERALETCDSGTPAGTIANPDGDPHIGEMGLDVENATYTYTSPNEASVNCYKQILFSAVADTTVFSGVFSDTITVTVANR